MIINKIFTMRNSLKQKYNRLIENLQNTISSVETIKNENKNIAGIQDDIKNTINRYIEDCKRNADKAINATVWDKLVIAFFGETGAGKSSIIETFRILFNEETREAEIKRKGSAVDGIIVGDGRIDYTTTCTEYNMSINGKEFILIDVPGIQGNEKEYKEEILKSLSKAHCVFYVQGDNKQPDEKIVERIKTYLSEWVYVYSIFNIRGRYSSYDEKDERENLITERFEKTESLITDVFEKTLGALYKGNISLQALLALCSKATFAPTEDELEEEQKKLIEYFGSEDLIFKFSRFEKIIELVNQKASNFKEEINEANKQKLIALCRQVYYGLKEKIETDSETFANFKKHFISFRTDIVKIINKTKEDNKRVAKDRCNTLFNNFKKQIYDIIDSPTKTKNKEESIKKVQEKLEKKFSKVIEDVLKGNVREMSESINKKRKELDAIKVINIKLEDTDTSTALSTVNAKNITQEMELKLGDLLELGVDVGSLALTGAGIGSLFTPIGTVIGVVVGGSLGLLKSFLFGDDRKGKAKEKARNEIDAIKETVLGEINEVVCEINEEIDSFKRKAQKEINKTINDFGIIEEQLNNTLKKIERMTSELKKQDYGKL